MLYMYLNKINQVSLQHLHEAYEQLKVHVVFISDYCEIYWLISSFRNYSLPVAYYFMWRDVG